ncbi:beta-ketoacyl-ACP synthase III [Streptomyces lavendofoliae]|uniref:beta-ketoacyl-ACP synthase III n=1 Tax=Streptomyces lavendofoliae TaxID=67314 RepID=UPI003D8A211A
MTPAQEDALVSHESSAARVPDDPPQPGRAAQLIGLGGWLPPREVTNAQVCAQLDTTDEWIRSRIGIATRRIADPSTATSDMAVKAGVLAMESAGTEHVDAVIVATSCPDHPVPATAPIVAHKLNQRHVPAFDIGAGCSGFLYATTVAAGLIHAASARTVLVIGAEKLSTITDPADRSTAPIFGDGAGAVVLTAGPATQPGAFGPVVWGSDGTYADALIVHDGGSRRPATTDGPLDHFVRMRGNEVLRHAIRRMSQAAREAATAAGWHLHDIDRLIVHQANARIGAGVANALTIPPERVPTNIARVANTSAASIPLLLADAAIHGHLEPSHRILMAAFGAGFTWAASTLVWPDKLRPLMTTTL